MLNPKAIRIAKECIQVVKAELDIKLTLSHPEFMQMLHEYVDLTDSLELADAYARLLAMAGVGNVLQSLKPKEQSDNVVPIGHNNIEMKTAVGSEYIQEDEKVEYGGKYFARWRGDKEFQGLYRGQPHYS